MSEPRQDSSARNQAIAVRYFWGDRLLQSTLHRDPTEVRIGATGRCEFDPADGLQDPQLTLLSPGRRGLTLHVPPGALVELTREEHTSVLPAGSHPLSTSDFVRVRLGRTRTEISFHPAPARVPLGRLAGSVFSAALALTTLAAGYFVVAAHFAPAGPSALSEDEARRVAALLRIDREGRPSVLNLVGQRLEGPHEGAEGRPGAAAPSHRSAPKAVDLGSQALIAKSGLLKLFGPAPGQVSSLGNMAGTKAESSGQGGFGGLGLRGGGAGLLAGLGALGATGHVGYSWPGSRGQLLPTAQASGEQLSLSGSSPFVATAAQRSSTFSIDVDTASYTMARRFLLDGLLPPPESVRAEEFLNSFSYEYPSPKDGPFAVHADGAPSPFGQGKHLLRVGVQARRVEGQRKPAHLTFLVDVSGSMSSGDKLPLAQRALELLVANLQRGDTVAIVTFSNFPREVLPPTGVEQASRIRAAIHGLRIEGSTGLYDGLKAAYAAAARSLAPGAISRVVLVSDGDANQGPTEHTEMLAAIRRHVLEGVTLTAVGFGMGRYQDRTMEQLADQGNGNYAYVGDLRDAHRAFVKQLDGTLQVVAKDVKVQVAFNPESVARHRLIGYENRRLAARDFADDKVDAGEIGAGHSVTALYEVELAAGRGNQSLATVAIRAKTPSGERATESSFVLRPELLWDGFDDAPADLRWAAGVAGAAELMRHGPHAAHLDYRTVARVACGATGGVLDREELCGLLRAVAAHEETLSFEGIGFERSGARVAAFQGSARGRR